MFARTVIIAGDFWFHKAESLRRCFSGTQGRLQGFRALRPAKGARGRFEALKGQG